MTLRVLLVGALFLGGLVAEEATARGKRVSQIPNGAAFSCNACHTAGGGSPRNAFGLELETNFLTAAGPAGDVIWGPELAALDSDGDGASNGAELGDPDGTWVTGDDNPEGEAFHPGDPESTPPLPPPDTAVEETTWGQIKK
ncbi:MAG: hypothetical protein OXI58_19240, partial [Gemmatimonadota bacterium]|nr:hypothetical protein [Gemmatimonadota bacterium]